MMNRAEITDSMHKEYVALKHRIPYLEKVIKESRYDFVVKNLPRQLDMLKKRFGNLKKELEL